MFFYDCLLVVALGRVKAVDPTDIVVFSLASNLMTTRPPLSPLYLPAARPLSASPKPNCRLWDTKTWIIIKTRKMVIEFDTVIFPLIAVLKPAAGLPSGGVKS